MSRPLLLTAALLVPSIAIAVCSLPTPIDDGVTWERTLHVSTTGSASGNGSIGDITETDSIIQQDPMMMDRAGGDYRLAQNSPARGAGRVVPGDAFPDFGGRCYADPPTLGAFENNGSDTAALVAPTGLRFLGIP